METKFLLRWVVIECKRLSSSQYKIVLAPEAQVAGVNDQDQPRLRLVWGKPFLPGSIFNIDGALKSSPE